MKKKEHLYCDDRLLYLDDVVWICRTLKDGMINYFSYIFIEYFRSEAQWRVKYGNCLRQVFL